MSGVCDVIVTPPDVTPPALRTALVEHGFTKIGKAWLATLDDAAVHGATAAFDEACGGDTGPTVRVLPRPIGGAS